MNTSGAFNSLRTRHSGTYAAQVRNELLVALVGCRLNSDVIGRPHTAGSLLPIQVLGTSSVSGIINLSNRIGTYLLEAQACRYVVDQWGQKPSHSGKGRISLRLKHASALSINGIINLPTRDMDVLPWVCVVFRVSGFGCSASASNPGTGNHDPSTYMISPTERSWYAARRIVWSYGAHGFVV